MTHYNAEILLKNSMKLTQTTKYPMFAVEAVNFTWFLALELILYGL